MERVTQDLTCLHGEVDKARAAAAAADAKVLELTNSIATFKAKSEDLGKKIEVRQKCPECAASSYTL